MEKNNAIRYMPTQNSKGWMPPIAAMVFLFIWISSFSKVTNRITLLITKYCFAAPCNLYLESKKKEFEMQAQKYSIKHWAEDDRPREKLLRKSPTSLSDSELMAILIRDGTNDRSSIDLAKDILALGKNNLHELGKRTVTDFMTIKGIGLAKAVSIAAALELGRRRQAESFRKPVVKSSKDVAQYLQSLLKDYNYEVFGVLYLNQGNKIRDLVIMSSGGITSTVADPRLILKKALEEDAVSLILCHNHPSGHLEPSQSDKELTIKITEAARYFDIRVLDHIIVSDEGYFSFADEGLI